MSGSRKPLSSTTTVVARLASSRASVMPAAPAPMMHTSAMARVLFLIVLVLTMLVFRGSRRLVYYEGLK